MSLSNNSPSCTTSSASTSTTVSFQQSATRPTLHFSPTATASQYNFLQSPFCGSNQIYQPRYPGDQDWGMGYSNFCPSPYLYMPTAPPSLPQYQPSSPFVLCFISENISTCFGCKTKYLKSLQPPDDLCIRHQDWREFFSPTLVTCKLSTETFITIVSLSACGSDAPSLSLLTFKCHLRLQKS